jgi:hypothetical protein
MQLNFHSFDVPFNVFISISPLASLVPFKQANKRTGRQRKNLSLVKPFDTKLIAIRR